MTTANITIVVLCDWTKIIPILFVRSSKNNNNTFFLVSQSFSSLCTPWDEKGWKSLIYRKKWINEGRNGWYEKVSSWTSRDEK